MTPDPASFDDLVLLAAAPVRPLMHSLRALVLRVAPDAVETVRLGDRAATWGTGPAKMKQGYVYIQPHAGWVNLGFYHGASLPDPAGLLTGTGKAMRHIPIASATALADPAIAALVAAARAERAAAGG